MPVINLHNIYEYDYHIWQDINKLKTQLVLELALFLLHTRYNMYGDILNKTAVMINSLPIITNSYIWVKMINQYRVRLPIPFFPASKLILIYWYQGQEKLFLKNKRTHHKNRFPSLVADKLTWQLAELHHILHQDVWFYSKGCMHTHVYVVKVVIQ